MYSETPDILGFDTARKIEVLPADEIKRVQADTYELLQEVGVHFPSQRALKIFADHGADVDWNTEIVRTHPDLVDKAMSTAPRSFVLGGREDRLDLVLDGSASTLCTDGCGVHGVDLGSRQRRPPRKAGVAMMARVSDSLPLIGFFWPLVSAQDCGRTDPLHECHAVALPLSIADHMIGRSDITTSGTAPRQQLLNHCRSLTTWRGVASRSTRPLNSGLWPIALEAR